MPRSHKSGSASVYSCESRGRSTASRAVDSYNGAKALYPSKPCTEHGYDEYHGAVKQRSYAHYQPSEVGTHVSRTSNVRGSCDFEGMPPVDYFSSGASKQDSAKWQQGYATQYLEVRWSGGRANPESIAPVHGSDKRSVYDDTCSIVPDDSISMFSQARSSQSKNSRRSNRSNRRFQSAIYVQAQQAPRYGGSSTGSRGLSDQGGKYGASESGGWGLDEQPFYDEINGYYVRIVRPDYTR